jgi:hypothetical protein
VNKVLNVFCIGICLKTVDYEGGSSYIQGHLVWCLMDKSFLDTKFPRLEVRLLKSHYNSHENNIKFSCINSSSNNMFDLYRPMRPYAGP